MILSSFLSIQLPFSLHYNMAPDSHAKSLASSLCAALVKAKVRPKKWRRSVLIKLMICLIQWPLLFRVYKGSNRKQKSPRADRAILLDENDHSKRKTLIITMI
jgi:hypothetical protein